MMLQPVLDKLTHLYRLEGKNRMTLAEKLDVHFARDSEGLIPVRPDPDSFLSGLGVINPKRAVVLIHTDAPDARTMSASFLPCGNHQKTPE